MFDFLFESFKRNRKKQERQSEDRNRDYKTNSIILADLGKEIINLIYDLFVDIFINLTNQKSVGFHSICILVIDNEQFLSGVEL